MDDYISREAAIALLKKWADGYSYIETPTEDAINEFNAIPPADVRPVVYGHMIGKEEAEKIFEEDYSDYPFGQCSVCGHCDWDCVESEGFNYCPNCGAKMGGTDGRQE